MTHRPTSIQAFHEAEASGQLNGKRFEVARAFQMKGPGTSAEVLRAAGLDGNRNLMRARVTELADCGWLKETETRKCKVTGRRAIVWSFEQCEPRKKIVRASREQLADALREACMLASSSIDVIVGEGLDDFEEAAGMRERLAELRGLAG